MKTSLVFCLLIFYCLLVYVVYENLQAACVCFDCPKFLLSYSVPQCWLQVRNRTYTRNIWAVEIPTTWFCSFPIFVYGSVAVLLSDSVIDILDLSESLMHKIDYIYTYGHTIRRSMPYKTNWMMVKDDRSWSSASTFFQIDKLFAANRVYSTLPDFCD